jgi:hypothetical protein
MNKPNPELVDHDLPQLDDDFFARARPAAEVMGEPFMARVRRPGRPKSAKNRGEDTPRREGGRTPAGNRQGLANPRERRTGESREAGAALRSAALR